MKRWQSLIRYASSGHLPIDNNPVENTIRPIALGMKTGCSPAPGAPEKVSTSSKPLLGIAKLNGLNPVEWLADTLEKLPTWPNSRIDELLPLASEAIEALLRECR